MSRIKEELFDNLGQVWLIICGDRILDWIEGSYAIAQLCVMDWEEFRPYECVDSEGVHNPVHLIPMNTIRFNSDGTIGNK